MKYEFLEVPSSSKDPIATNRYPTGELLSQCNFLFYFVPFVFFVDELPFLGSIF